MNCTLSSHIDWQRVRVNEKFERQDICARAMEVCPGLVNRMAPEENIVPLIVQCCHLAALEVRVLGKERGKHPAHPPAHERVEVLQYQLRLELPSTSMALHDSESFLRGIFPWSAESFLGFGLAVGLSML